MNRVGAVRRFKILAVGIYKHILVLLKPRIQSHGIHTRAQQRQRDSVKRLGPRSHRKHAVPGLDAKLPCKIGALLERLHPAVFPGRQGIRSFLVRISKLAALALLRHPVNIRGKPAVRDHFFKIQKLQVFVGQLLAEVNNKP